MLINQRPYALSRSHLKCNFIMSIEYELYWNKENVMAGPMEMTVVYDHSESVLEIYVKSAFFLCLHY